MEPEVIHIPELAKLLGRSEPSIRSAMQSHAAWLPPFFKQGKRICWRLESVRKFLSDWEQSGVQQSKPGRKRKQPSTLIRIR